MATPSIDTGKGFKNEKSRKVKKNTNKVFTFVAVNLVSGRIIEVETGTTESIYNAILAQNDACTIYVTSKRVSLHIGSIFQNNKAFSILQANVTSRRIYLQNMKYLEEINTPPVRSNS